MCLLNKISSRFKCGNIWFGFVLGKHKGADFTFGVSVLGGGGSSHARGSDSLRLRFALPRRLSQIACSRAPCACRRDSRKQRATQRCLEAAIEFFKHLFISPKSFPSTRPVKTTPTRAHNWSWKRQRANQRSLASGNARHIHTALELMEFRSTGKNSVLGTRHLRAGQTDFLQRLCVHLCECF